MARKKGSCFYRIDRSALRRASELGFRPLVAYLVLAAFSNANNDFTKASIQAVERHGRLPRPSASKAVNILVDAGLLRRRPTKPPTYDIWVPEVREDIWLPTQIVVRPKGDFSTTPLDRVRCAGDVHLLHLWIDLYAVHSLAEHGGVSPALIKQAYSGERVSSRCGVTLWTFEPGEISFDSDAFQRHCCDAAGGSGGFIERVKLLQALGCIDLVPYVYGADADDPDWEYSFKEDSDVPVERAVSKAVHEALLRVPWPGITRTPRCPLMLWQHEEKVVVGTLRIRNRPQTGKTSAWLARLNSGSNCYLSSLGAMMRALGGPSLPTVELRRAIARCQSEVQEQDQRPQDQLLQDQLLQVQRAVNGSVKGVSTPVGVQVETSPREGESGSEGSRSRRETHEPQTAEMGRADAFESRARPSIQSVREAAPASAVESHRRVPDALSRAPSGPVQSTPSMPLPDDFEPDSAGVEAAQAHNVPIDEAMQALRARAEKFGPCPDWQAQFRNMVVLSAFKRGDDETPVGALEGST